MVRFDGESFEPYHLPSGEDLLSSDISVVTATPEGGLWIGYHWRTELSGEWAH